MTLFPLNTIARLLRSPWLIMLGMASGVCLGIYAPDFSRQIEPLGEIYLTLLTMCVIPIMMSAVISSFGRLLSSRQAAGYLRAIALVFCVGILLATAVGLTIGILGQPGTGISQETKAILGSVLLEAERQAGDAHATVSTETNWISFAKMMIPANIFGALSEGKNLQILFFSLVFGLAVGTVSSEHREQFLNLTEVVFKAFERLIGLAMYVLPFALVGMIAGQIAGTGSAILFAMGRYIIVMHLAILSLLIAAGSITAWAGKKSFISVFRELYEPLFVAFGTRSGYAAIPSMLSALRNNFCLPLDSINLVIPLSIVICRYSLLLVFTIGSIFIAELYDITLETHHYIIIFGGGCPGDAGRSRGARHCFPGHDIYCPGTFAAACRRGNYSVAYSQLYH